ncbi:glycosyltransferase [Palleronia caenipelagi]|uniref:glycosyltransferase n=1 Tax=Palleronia caenipelagi TaxID=2489174 RepID=UPI001FEC48D9|nr:glycosyltransferase [Palleronia caenipelagi]
MKAALILGRHPVPGQTFVNRHIERLFDGNTILACTGRTKTSPYGKPVFDRRHVAMPLTDSLRAPVVMGWNAWRHGTSRITFGARRQALRTFLKEHRPDVVLGEFGTDTLAFYDVPVEMGLPVFTYFRGKDASTALRRPARVRGYATMLPRLSGIIAVSQFLVDNLAASGLTHANTHVLPSGVDTARFLPGEKRPGHCVAVGRMVEKKAPLLTLRAFAEATRDRPDAHLTMVGDGPLLPELEALARELGAADRITLPGALPHDEVRAALAGAELFLQHSVTAANGDTEGLPSAIQEAMATGCVVVSTRHAGIPEAVIEDETGYLVEEHDADGFRDRIAKALSDDTAQMGQAARARAVEQLDTWQLMARLEDVLRAAVPHS